jgi:hypothetical protein
METDTENRANSAKPSLTNKASPTKASPTKGSPNKGSPQKKTSPAKTTTTSSTKVTPVQVTVGPATAVVDNWFPSLQQQATVFSHARMSSSMQQAPWGKKSASSVSPSAPPQQVVQTPPQIPSTSFQELQHQQAQTQTPLAQPPRTPSASVQIPASMSELKKNVPQHLELKILARLHSILINFFLVPNIASELSFLLCMLKIPMETTVKPLDAYVKCVFFLSLHKVSFFCFGDLCI